MDKVLARQTALDAIQQNILRRGHHIYIVLASSTPRFAYTIGLSESLGFELVLAGAIFFMADEVVAILNALADAFKSKEAKLDRQFQLPEFGGFEFRKVHPSWTKLLLLGALDFYNIDRVPVLQIVPDRDHWTSDIPDLNASWNPTSAPAWQWLETPWQLQVPETSKAITNLAALQGERITEAGRWEEDEWELFAGAGPDVPKSETRIVPIGTLLAEDASLAKVLELSVGQALWRDEASDWHEWKTNSSDTSPEADTANDRLLP